MDTTKEFGTVHMMHGKVLTETAANAALLRAWNDLERWRDMLRGMADVIPGTARPMVLEWLRDWRVYLLEKNVERWPDGLYHVVNRDYLPWRKHQLAFSPDELHAAFADCCADWPRSWKDGQPFFEVMHDECYFKIRRAPYVASVAEIMRGICHAALARLNACGPIRTGDA